MNSGASRRMDVLFFSDRDFYDIIKPSGHSVQMISN